MIKGILTALFIKASDRFLLEERELIISGVSERCLCGALMLRLRDVFNDSKYADYFTDIEYNRNFSGSVKQIITPELEQLNITCDLIVHSRGQNAQMDNLIAIEMKRKEHPYVDKQRDKQRLVALTTINM